MYREDLLDKIAQENETAAERVSILRKPETERFKDKLDALWGTGVPFSILGYPVELKFTMRSWAFLETNDIQNADAQTQVILFAMASTMHNEKINWSDLYRNGYQIDEEFQHACMEAWEKSKPLPPTCPPDSVSERVMNSKPKPGGFGIDYMSMLVTLGKQFGWTKTEFWEMSPREIGLILDEYNWDIHYQNQIEKAHMKQNKRGR